MPLLSDTQVHASLVNPKIREALAQVCKDPQSATFFMNDEDVRPVIILVSQIINGQVPN
jgi:hypothetical protein